MTSEHAEKDLSIICVDTRQPEVAAKSVCHSVNQLMPHVRVRHVHWFSHVQFPHTCVVPVITHEISPITHMPADYNKIIMYDLASCVTTSHALIVQWDGFVVNGAAWRSEFWDYDYIGAVWPPGWCDHDPHNVGNGGFSLRSRRLCELVHELGLNDHITNEDKLICRIHRLKLEQLGIRFAPAHVAHTFSVEGDHLSPGLGTSLGFHGPWLSKYYGIHFS